MDTNIWSEPGAPLLREAVRQEARRWHHYHQPPRTLPEWQVLRQELRLRMHELAGSFPAPVPLDLRKHGTLQLDGYRIDKISYQSRVDLRVTANLYVPDAKGVFPGILNVHGHWPQGKISAHVAGRCHTFAKAGFVVLAVDAFGAGERGTKPGEFEYHGSRLGATLWSLGESLLGMQVYDNQRGLDLLESLGYVDPERLGVTGASGGGNQTMWLAAFDDRIKAAVPVVSVGTFESYVTNCNCVCEVFPEGLTLMEEWAALALVAPKALLLLNSMQDGPTFAVTEMIRSFSAAREVFRLFGVPEKIAYRAINLPHGYWPEMRSHALGWFKLWLQGEGHGLPSALPTVPELPEPELMCFPGKTRPPEIKTIITYVAARGQEYRRSLADPATPLDALAKRTELSHLLKLPAITPRPRLGPIVRDTDAGLTVERFAIESEPGVLLACLRLTPAGARPKADLIAVHGQGKAALVDHQAVRQALAAGMAVCLVDLRCLGETNWDPKNVCEHHDAMRAALWLGRTMIGDWVSDLRAVRQVLVEEFGAARVEVFAQAEPGLAALAGAAVSNDFASVTVRGVLSSYAITDAAPAQGLSVVIPGILRWGDVSLLAALAQGPLTVEVPVTPAGTALTAEALTAWDQEVRSLAARLGLPGRVPVAAAGS